MATNNQEEVKLDYDFILEMFKGCLTDKTFLEIVLSHCKSNFLPEGPMDKLFREIRSQYKTEGKKPTVGTLKIAFRKERTVLELIDEVKEIDSVDTTSLLTTLEEFIKSANFIEVYNSCATEFAKGNKKQAYTMFQQGSELINELSLNAETFETVFGDFNSRQTERIMKKDDVFKVPTGIDELDRALNGGAESGELHMYLAESKGAKSFLLTHLGLHSARTGYPVAHFQAEGKKQACFNRYDANWSGSFYHDVKNGIFSDKKYAAYKRIVENLGKTDIHVFAKQKFGAMTMIGIRKKVIDLMKKHDIKVVIIDYLDLINPDDEYYRPGDERFRQQKTAQMMKDLAMELNIVVITVTQATILSIDQKNDPDFVLTREHLAEDKGKVRPVDVLVTLNRTKDEEENGIMRLHIDAAREHKWRRPIVIKQNLDRSRFYDRKATLQEFFEDEMSAS